MSCLKIFPFLKEHRAELEAVAATDNHLVMYPTHSVNDGTEMVGYVSAFSIPSVSVWLHTKRVKAIDSVRLLNQLEGGFRMNGLKEYIMPCMPTSPFHSNMERLGFRSVGEVTWFYKDLTKD